MAITLQFSEAVAVTNENDLGLTLETGTNDRMATYTSGSGSNTLAFTYTIQAGDASADLDYKASNSLSTGATGTIKDVAGNSATLTLPAIGAATSLAFQKALVIDTVGPAISSVSSPTNNGSYRAGQTISIEVVFAENVTVTNSGNLILTMETGTTDRNASYASGSGTATLTFSYVVQAGDISSDLDYTSTSALGLGASGTIKDAIGNDALLTLPSVGGVNSIAGQKVIVIDTVNPVDPSSVAFGSSSSVTTTVSMSWTASTDAAGFSTHNVKMCTSNNCSTGCTTATTSASSPASLTGSNATTYYGCVQGVDVAGNTSNWVASASSILIDSSIPVVNGVSSSTANGSYGTNGSPIAITVTFSQTVSVTNGTDLKLRLSTGDAAARYATYNGGSGSSSLSFVYPVVSGDNIADLDYYSTTALTITPAGTIKNGTKNAILTLPAVGGASSLGGQKNITLDTMQKRL